ncbi:hypothetical protein MGYG_08220 [Nannizzia gypsea CBS 118893]|uniref:Uncharacterized protein n=1 Tax=Arthroderma gypseum (strain ATCC MYA-4604 / CBS 118893) TaxID=535722 RepID=E4V5D2_ARTGP|nr:hypothetical protein MGYG_08220 [Nannizzia gypsea CBS 118893]EFR05206.1 hypothetical protein MGYG_08220 [Nannizzia gypsea CBS 118893]
MTVGLLAQVIINASGYGFKIQTRRFAPGTLVIYYSIDSSRGLTSWRIDYKLYESQVWKAAILITRTPYTLHFRFKAQRLIILTNTMGQAISYVATATRRLARAIRDNFKFYYAVPGALLALAPVLGPTILGAFGFTAIGPAAGSLAALWHASIGNVAAGSVFAWCQSAAMGGGAAGVFNVAGGVGAGLLGSAAVQARRERSA